MKVTIDRPTGTITDIFKECLTIRWDNGDVETHQDHGEPEDNLFCRDWRWVAPAIERAYGEGNANRWPLIGENDRLRTLLQEAVRYMPISSDLFTKSNKILGGIPAGTNSGAFPPGHVLVNAHDIRAAVGTITMGVDAVLFGTDGSLDIIKRAAAELLALLPEVKP